jgi:hypothetical protein
MCCLSNKHETPLLDRRGGLWRGAEGDETEAGVVEIIPFAQDDRNPDWRQSTTPSPDTRFARSGTTPPVQEGSL